jgi:phosphate transport system protein
VEHDRTTDIALPRGVEEIPARVEGDRPESMRSVPRASLDREERIIKETLLRMASLIEERIRLTIRALETHDAALALTVIEGDAEINAMQAEALDHIIRTIATQAPVARDLRFLLTLDHIAYELERIGDSIANVAKRVRDVAPHAPLAEYVGIPEMGRLAARILADVGRALVDSDVSVARAVASQDDAIDAHYHRATDELIRLGQADPANVERAARLLIAAHYLERIGDRVTNIAEDVVFLATGEHEDLNA